MTLPECQTKLKRKITRLVLVGSVVLREPKYRILMLVPDRARLVVRIFRVKTNYFRSRLHDPVYTVIESLGAGNN